MFLHGFYIGEQFRFFFVEIEFFLVGKKDGLRVGIFRLIYLVNRQDLRYGQVQYG